jgi:hypothetical protein
VTKLEIEDSQHTSGAETCVHRYPHGQKLGVGCPVHSKQPINLSEQVIVKPVAINTQRGDDVFDLQGLCDLS